MGKIMDNWQVFFFLYKKTIKNRVKKALRKPVTYIYLLLVIIYFVFFFRSFSIAFFDMWEEGSAETASALTALLTAFTFFIIPSNLISYCKRKGLIFRQPDIHFLFSAPLSPKNILLYSHIKAVVLGMILSVILTIGGVVWFHMPVWKMLVYLLFSCVVENILEASMMVLCYGNERLDRKQMFLLQLSIYTLWFI